MKKRGIFLLIVFLIIVVIAVLVVLYHKTWNLDFEEEESFEYNHTALTQEDHNNTLKWFSLRHNSYQGANSIDTLKRYGVDVEGLHFDFDNYTYIFTVGHRLISIKHNYSIFDQRNVLLLPNRFVGIVTLNKQCEDKIFVYRIRRLNINSHKNPNEYIVWYP